MGARRFSHTAAGWLGTLVRGSLAALAAPEVGRLGIARAGARPRGAHRRGPAEGPSPGPRLSGAFFGSTRFSARPGATRLAADFQVEANRRSAARRALPRRRRCTRPVTASPRGVLLVHPGGCLGTGALSVAARTSRCRVICAEAALRHGRLGRVSSACGFVLGAREVELLALGRRGEKAADRLAAVRARTSCYDEKQALILFLLGCAGLTVSSAVARGGAVRPERTPCRLARRQPCMTHWSTV